MKYYVLKDKRGLIHYVGTNVNKCIKVMFETGYKVIPVEEDKYRLASMCLTPEQILD